LQVSTPPTTTSADFIVVPQSTINILGYQTATSLDILHINIPDGTVKTLNTDAEQLTSVLSKYYADRFKGLGKLKEVKVNIHTNENIQPVAQKARRLPITVQKQVDEELDKLLELGVIEPVTEPTTWVSPLVVKIRF